MTHIPSLQKFWHNFAGAALDTNVWTLANLGAMVDEVDGGFQLTTTTTTSNTSSIDFILVDHFDHQNSVSITTHRHAVTTSIWCVIGLGADLFQDNFHVVEARPAVHANYQLVTDGSGVTRVNSAIAIDTNPHNYKIQNTSANATLDIDGVLEATSTTTLSAAAMAPFFWIRNVGSTAQDTRIKYFEAYNR